MKDEGGRMKDEGGRMRDEGGRMKDEGIGRMKDEGIGRMKNEGIGRMKEVGVWVTGNQLQLVDFTDDIVAFQFVLETNVDPHAQLASGVPADWQMVVNQLDEDQWFVGAYGVTPLTSKGLIQFQNDAKRDIRFGQINEIPVKYTPAVNVPQHFVLHAAYPNPFNPQTTIRFDLPLESTVDLAVYDLAGKRICSLVTGRRNAGYHQVEWNGTNDHGQAVSSGIYFYRLQTDTGFRATASMILLK
ncbi:MAG: T9SS C-terminal target domain-containing protein [Gemmatimonadetes bacterium]|nr:MAG: T9SS C-terminal target domain-containing protein [Gemmatimonadota bacterium]